MCRKEKKSKLAAFLTNKPPTDPVCNGCYGTQNVMKSTGSDDGDGEKKKGAISGVSSAP